MKALKPAKRAVHGIVLLDKPIGMSSNKALKKVQHLFRAEKAGHTGSLDPLATGLLPICLGEATKLAQYLLSADKKYCVTAKLGQQTNTYDAEGEVVRERAVPPLTAENLENLLVNFRGEIKQTPPLYSALKLAGKPLYQYAREGIALVPQSRPVHIYELKLLKLFKDSVQLEVHCSKGTYIRSLVNDLGEALACGAHITHLRRIACAGYSEVQMLSLETLEKASGLGDNPTALDHYLLPMRETLSDWPELRLDQNDQQRFQRGQSIKLSAPMTAPRGLKICSEEGELLGLAELIEATVVAPRKVFQL